MIKMTIAPLIFVTVTHVFCSNVGGEKMGKVAFKSILFYKVVTVFPNTKVYQIRIDGVIIGIYT